MLQGGDFREIQRQNFRQRLNSRDRKWQRQGRKRQPRRPRESISYNDLGARKVHERLVISK